MSLKDVVPGVYDARVVDYGLQEVEKLGALKAVIKFAFKCDGQDEMITWDGFLLKKDGEMNKHTMDTLIACGFKSQKIIDLTGASALDTQKPLTITIEKEGEYLKVKWVNDPAKTVVKTDVKKLKGYNLSKFDSYLAMNNKPERKVKNHADAIVAAVASESEDLPF